MSSLKSVCFLPCRKDGRSKDALERGDNTAVFFAALRHAEHFEDRRPGFEPHRLALLADCESCQKDRNQSILSVRQAERGMSGDLQLEMAVLAFVQKSAARRSPQRQPTKHEGTGTESEGSLVVFFPDPDKLDAFDLAKLLLGDDELAVGSLKNGTGEETRFCENNPFVFF
jgi:hypothetical protein